MPTGIQRLVRDLLPPMISRPLARRFLDIRYTGDYSSWAEAGHAATGYDAPNILEQVTEAVRQVRDGKVAYERDGVTFAEPDYRWPLLAALLREAARQDGRLRVLDFGGSLGSTYYQHRRLLQAVKELRWGVVEQAGFVEAGRREFTTAELSFYATIEEALTTLQPTVILFSGVLAWIENPHAILEQVVAAGPPAILIDRTPVSPQARDVAKLQRVPARIYRASYPCWFFSRDRVLAHFSRDYELLAEFPPFEAPVPGVKFAGFHFERRQA